MAEEQDDAQKTEEPSQRKLEEAYKKGDAPRSQEVKNWFMILAIGLAVAITAPHTAQSITSFFKTYLSNLDTLPAGDGRALLMSMRDVFWTMALAIAFPVLILIIGAIAGNLVQGHIVFSGAKLKPKLSKISPISGAKRLFSRQSVVELVKSLAKLTVTGCIVVWIIWPERGLLLSVTRSPLSESLDIVFGMALRLIGGVLAAMTAIAILDYVVQRQQFMKRQRMTKQEVKDEHKQSEGDPQVKARIRQIRTERTRQRIAQAVPESDVVITNPTHFAVALKYTHGEMSAPIVTAMGADHLAARIRTLAGEHDIPLVENPPLARALYATGEIDQEIPVEHFKAVAEVIGYVMRLKRDPRAKYRPSS